MLDHKPQERGKEAKTSVSFCKYDGNIQCYPYVLTKQAMTTPPRPSPFALPLPRTQNKRELEIFKARRVAILAFLALPLYDKLPIGLDNDLPSQEGALARPDAQQRTKEPKRGRRDGSARTRKRAFVRTRKHERLPNLHRRRARGLVDILIQAP